MEKTKAKYLISQINPRLLNLFLKNVRRNKIIIQNDLIEKFEKKNELLKRDRTLLSELIKILISFNVLETNQTEKEFILTEKGNNLKQIMLVNEGLFYELYHLMNYYAFDVSGGELTYLPFKSYQVLCNRLFEIKKDINRKKMADMVDSYMMEKFNVDGSFSEVCITRGLAWVKKLEPALFNDKGLLVERKPKYIEPILLSIDYIYKIKGINYNDPLFIDDEEREKISMSCLVSEKYIDESLKEIASEYPQKLAIKYSISGMYLILKNSVNIRDLK